MKMLIATAALLLVSACGSDSDGSSADPAPESSSPAPASSDAGPAQAVEQLITALEAGSCDDVKAIVVTPSTVDCELVDSLGGSFAEQGVDLEKVTYDAGQVEGDNATVTIGWGDGDPDETWDVERIDDAWKVLFDSEA
ncbi:MAG: hypothetical protein ABW075_11610 [Aeromicrobium sp.]